MASMPADDGPDQESRLPIALNRTFDELLVAAEHELTCCREAVRAMRCRQRRQRWRELRAALPRLARTGTRIGLFTTGMIAFLAGMHLLLAGQPGSADLFSAAAAAWAAAAAIPPGR